jgi:tetratricopeptide (TPR) repeat protein
MAFGFGFNKQKVLNTAEKFVQQGKLQNAITEYEKILKNDPKELTVMNTVGDLYSRLGNSEKAVECFKSVGDAYASQGFTVKAIAMYKKLSKLKSSLECVLRLAELYTQQGLFNDARAQYLQVAEEFLRNGELEQAVRIFQKTLEMDPENVSMRTKLAEVYVRLGKKTEAWQIFSAAAETLRSKGQLQAAEEILRRMLTLDPNSSYALLLKGKNAFENGDMATTVQSLEKVADLDSNADGMRTLLQAYVQTGRFSDAGTLAEKLLSVHNDVPSVLGYADALISGGQFEPALQVYQQHSDRLLAADSGKVLENLHSLIGHVRENPPALESLLELLNKAGDNSHLTEVYELLAHAYVQGGHLDKARDYYLKLTQLEPENQIHARNYQQVLSKLGAGSNAKLITAEEGAVMVDELEATAPFIDQRYTDEIALAIRAAQTDAELFISYNMPAKALGPLLSALPQAPRDLRLNQRLAALHTRAGRFTEAAVCCRTLEGIYHDAGYPEEATRYGELAAKYEERAAVGPVPAMVVPIEDDYVAPAATPVEAAEAEPTFEVAAPVMEEPVAEAPETPQPFFHGAAQADDTQETAEFEVKAEPVAEESVDISDEWESTVSDETVPTEAVAETKAAAPVASEEEITEAVEEVRFYLGNGMAEEAEASFTRLQHLGADPARVAELRSEINAAKTAKPVQEEPVSLEQADTFVEPEAETSEVEIQKEEPKAGALDSLVSDLESSLGDGFLPQTTAAEPQPVPEAVPEPAVASAATQPKEEAKLTEFVADLETSLGDSFLAAAPVAQEPEVKRVEVPVAQVAAPAPPAEKPVAMAAAAPTGAPVTPTTPPPTFTYQPTPIRQLAPEPPSWPAPANSAGVDLAGMFGELKQELEEEATVAEEDPETHYNLGVAFREMGLLDEAIGELQKVCQTVERGHPFPQIMQTYTWLSQCFLDKGVPEAAIRWYEKALALPDLDQETRTALHYELASAHELAGNKPAALKHFMEVYGSNIDYRDVAERIKSLKS